MKNLNKVTNDNGVITALAIDQRNSLKDMLGELGTTEHMVRFKEIVAEHLSPYAAAILLDPQYGLSAAQQTVDACAAIFSYEVSGYRKDEPGRLPTLLDDWSAAQLKENGADAVKLLVYYDPDEDAGINDRKKNLIQCVGIECNEAGLPFFLEIITYDYESEDTKGKAFALKRPHKIIASMEEFSQRKYAVDVLKVEVPVNMYYVEGYGEDFIYTKDEARAFFQKQNDVTDVPFIFLSGGVPTDMFIETLEFAHEAGSNFNGILGGRAIWKESIGVYVREGEDAAAGWMRTKGRENILYIMDLVDKIARPV